MALAVSDRVTAIKPKLFYKLLAQLMLKALCWFNDFTASLRLTIVREERFF
ncbi:MAG: hypothetical protein MUD14_09455 [Hydrococcus sp. Prado102]|nr:hypothetical protein [Hydrococcus sp. Prado102]